MTLQIELPESLQDFLKEQAEKEGFETIGDYVQSVFQEIRKKRAKKELHKKLREGMRAPKTRMTKERWEKLEKKIFESPNNQ